MFIELHILQNFAPSNLNRDDTGNPKDTEFGGVRRARISSQCIKRAVRAHPVFAQTTQTEISTRSRWTTRLLAAALEKAGKPEADAWAVAQAFLESLGLKLEMDKRAQKMRNTVLLFFSTRETQSISRRLLEEWDSIMQAKLDSSNPVLIRLAKEYFKDFASRPEAPDIALFGRMMAEKPELNLDAACQVAHAISTHRVNMEMDFYTAVDDLTSEDETGAGMMGVTAFNSATYYRYARVDWEQLLTNLNGDVDLATKTVEGFLRASITAVPSAKQNGFAAQNQPDFILGVARTDGQSWSLANAFETPVRMAREGGLLLPSMAALDCYWGDMVRVYGADGLAFFAMALNQNAPLQHLKPGLVAGREAWVNALVGALPKG